LFHIFEDISLVERCKVEGPRRVKELFDKNGVFAEKNLDFYKGILK
jgi:hypothetical protein